MNKKKQLLLNLALTIFFVAAVIVRGPNLNPLYSDGAFTWCFVISCYVVLNFFICLGSLRLSTNEYNRIQFSIDSSVKSVKRGFVLLGILWVLYFAVSLLSIPLFNYKAYRDQLGTPVVSEFNETVQPLALNQLPIVDRDLARELADKKVGENPGLGSQVVRALQAHLSAPRVCVYRARGENEAFYRALGFQQSASFVELRVLPEQPERLMRRLIE